MKASLTCAIASVLILLSGCAPLAPLNFSVPNVGPSQRKIDAELRSMTVTVARPDEAKGNLELSKALLEPAVGRSGGENAITQMWQTAITESLNKMVIFQDDAQKKVNLSVKILQFDVPEYQLEYTVTTTARYELIDRRTGDLIFTQDLTSTGTTPGSYGPLLVRSRESVNRAVQNNITLFLQALETVDVQKPMFPVNSKSK